MYIVFPFVKESTNEVARGRKWNAGVIVVLANWAITLLVTRRHWVSSSLLTTKELIMNTMKNKQDKRKRKQIHEYWVDKEKETQSTRQTVHKTGINTSIQKVVVVYQRNGPKIRKDYQGR